MKAETRNPRSVRNTNFKCATSNITGAIKAANLNLPVRLSCACVRLTSAHFTGVPCQSLATMYSLLSEYEIKTAAKFP